MSGDFVETSRPVMDWVLRTTWEASLIAALVLIAQHLLRGRVSARWRYNLWLLVVARLLLPAVPGTHYSPFNLIRLPQASSRPVAPQEAPRRPVTPAEPVRVIPVPGPAPVAPQDRAPIYFASQVVAPAPTDAQSGHERVAFTDGLFENVGAKPQAAVHAGVTTPSRASPEPMPSDVMKQTGGTGDHLPAPAAAPAPAPARALPQHPHAIPPLAASQSSPTVPAPATRPWHQRVNWTALAALVWVAGAGFVAARLAWVTLRLAAAVRGLRPVRDAALDQLLRECAAQLHLRRLPQVLEAPDGFGPALVGLLRPRVVLPACVLRGSFHRDELRLVLMHELAHLKRWDVAANWLLAVLGVLHWFNPVLWLTFRRMRLDRELACDELVLSATAPTVARAYGPTLLKLLQTLSRRPALPGMVGVLEGKQSIRRRIAMIARFDRSNRNSSPLFGVALSVLAGGVALTGAVRGQQSPPPGATPAVDVRELSVELTRDDDASRERAEAEREEREAQRQADREAEDQARAAAREAEDEARNAAREAEDQARQAARESEDQARQSHQEAVESTRERTDAAREHARELQQAMAERQQAAQERAKEAEESIAEAQRNFEQRAAETQDEIAEARKALDEAQQEAANREQDLRKELDEAKQSLVDHQASEPAEGDDDAAREAAERLQELTGAVEEKERELAEAASERERARQDGQAELERAAGERERTLEEARAELERATGEHQEALAEAARDADQAARDLEGALSELAVAQDELTRAQAAEPAQPIETPPEPQPAPSPSLELPPDPTAPDAPIEPIPPEPQPAPAAETPAVPPGGIGPIVSIEVVPVPESAATPAAGDLAAVAPPSAESAPAVGLAPSSAAPDAAQPAAGLPPPTPAPAAEVPHPTAQSTPAIVGAAPSVTPAPRAGNSRPARAAASPSRTPNAYGGYGRGGGYPGAGNGYPGAMGGYPPNPQAGGYGGAAQNQPGGMGRGYGGYGMMGMGGGAAPARGGPPDRATAARIENPAARDADRRTGEALRRSLPVNFDNVPLEEVLRFIADAAKVDVIADWKGLEAAGIDRNAPVAITLRQGAPVEQVLTWVLRAAAGDVLGYAIDHGVVIVAPQERIDRMVITRAYPLGALADNGQGLEQLVRDTVAPQSWRESGGPAAVRAFNNQLFVTATEPNHRQVERLLGLMEAQRVPAPAAGMMPGMGAMPGMFPVMPGAPGATRGGLPGAAPAASPAGAQ